MTERIKRGESQKQLRENIEKSVVNPQIEHFVLKLSLGINLWPGLKRPTSEDVKKISDRAKN